MPNKVQYIHNNKSRTALYIIVTCLYTLILYFYMSSNSLLWILGTYSITFNLLTDINECIEGTSGFQHICHNNIGSFTCSCNPGYVPPGTNWKSCVGKLMYRLFCVFALSSQFNVMCPGLSTKYSGSLLHPSLSLLTNHVY